MRMMGGKALPLARLGEWEEGREQNQASPETVQTELLLGALLTVAMVLSQRSWEDQGPAHSQ